MSLRYYSYLYCNLHPECEGLVLLQCLTSPPILIRGHGKQEASGGQDHSWPWGRVSRLCLVCSAVLSLSLHLLVVLKNFLSQDIFPGLRKSQ